MANEKDKVPQASSAPAFGFTAPVRDVSRTPFPVEAHYKEYMAGNATDPWHIAILTNVKARQYVKEKYLPLEGVVVPKDERPTIDQVTDDSIGNALDFFFESPDGTYSFTHTIWEIFNDDPKKVDKKQWDNETLARLWGGIYQYGTADVVFSPAGLAKFHNDEPVTNYKAYFETIAAIFNTYASGNPVYKDGNGKPIVYRIKLVLYENRETFPRFDNFIEPFSTNVASRLAIKPNDNFDMVKKQKKTNAGAGSQRTTTTAGSADAWPTDI